MGVAGVHVVLPLGVPGDVSREAQRGHLPHRVGVADREPLDAGAVHAHVQLLGRRVADDVVREVPVEADPYRVLAVDGEVVPNRDAAARAERQQVVLPLVLHQAGMHPVGRDGGADGGDAHGETADSARRRKVPRHQVRRDREHVAVVVEAVLVGVVGRQQLGDVDVYREQVADRGVIFGPVQAVERLAAAGVGTGQGHRVDGRLQPGGDGAVRFLGRSRVPRRRHRPCAQLDDDLLPGLGVGADVREIVRVEGQIGRAQPVVVAAHAEPVERCSNRVCGRSDRGLRGLGDCDVRAAGGGEHADQDHEDSDHGTGSSHHRRFHAAIIPPNVCAGAVSLTLSRGKAIVGSCRSGGVRLWLRRRLSC